MTSNRTDIHRPAEFDPADYRVVDYLDVKAPVCPAAPGGLNSAALEGFYAAFEAYRQQWQDRIFKYFPDWRTGGTDHQSIHQCNHCGHRPIRWVAVVEHIPTGKFLAFGDVCADRVEIPGRDKFRSKFIRTRAENEAKALENKLARETFLAEGDNRRAIDFLVDRVEGHNDYGYNGFYFDILHKFNRYGSLSEKQIAAVLRGADKQAQFEARKAEEAKTITAAFPEGRQTVTGEIVSVKEKDGYLGDPEYKMLIKLADGNKVFGSIPGSVQESVARDRYDNRFIEGFLYALQQALVGKTVTFTATFEVSKNDAHFGFFKRPTNASVVSQQVAA